MQPRNKIPHESGAPMQPRNKIPYESGAPMQPRNKPPKNPDAPGDSPYPPPTIQISHRGPALRPSAARADLGPYEIFDPKRRDPQ